VQLLLIRHAVAEEREEFAASGLTDDLRPLSDEGRRKMERGARGLARLLGGLDRLASSPLVRARQTAEIVAAAFGGLSIVETPTLAPDTRPDRFLAWLAGGASSGAAGVVAAVGHQPHLGRLAGRLLRGDDRPVVEFKKGSAALFEVDLAGGTAVLRWSLAPAQLRSLGRPGG
jgi:phosphohistidine phosphatase